MKKTFWKVIVFIFVFLGTVFAAEKVMNQGHENMTVEIAEPVFPIIVIEQNGLEYNELYGYKNWVNTAFLNDNMTMLEEDRSIGFILKVFDTRIDSVSVEVRSSDGERLIEKTEIDDLTVSGGEIHQKIRFKDLIEKDTEYLMVFRVEIKDMEIKYYSRILWSDSCYLSEKLDFVQDFHERLFDKEAAKEIAKYLEPDSLLEDNKSFYKVNIHSNFRQITYGNLKITKETEPIVTLKDIDTANAAFVLDFIVSTGGEEKIYYRVKEYYRIWYSSEVQYLLDYERIMVQMPQVGTMYANDKILLGITDWNVQMKENDDGNVVAFVDDNSLFSYNVTTNSLVKIFSFADENDYDRRKMNDCHNIRILDVTEGGNVEFAVYGYMNRGRHEGEVGIQLYSYDNQLNTIEENIYIPYNKTYDVLKCEMEQILYLNRERKLFLELENKVYTIDLAERTFTVLTDMDENGEIRVSGDNRILVSLVAEGIDPDHCRSISIYNLGTEKEKKVTVSANESIHPLGFMGEDIIYGIARNEDITVENSGRVFFPMYKLCICDYNGKLLKEYQQENIYVTNCSVENNQITINRLERSETGIYKTIADDHITNNVEISPGRNTVVAAEIDVYERYVQIQVRSRIDEKTIKILTPKEVVFEGGRTLKIDLTDADRYYVYGAFGVEKITDSAAKAVASAEAESGAAADKEGTIVWRSAPRASRNQIMSITEESVTEEKGSIAVCTDVILKYEGIAGNSQYLLEKGESVFHILENYLEKYKILDLTGCSLTAMLYYVNQDIPVMVLLKDGEAVLITGYNSSEIVVMDPSIGSLYKKGINATMEWLEENGNSFITYSK